VFISRGAAARRRLSNEDDLWPILARAGFEKVQMERLAFSQQVALMRQTAVLVAPHGAGLANMMFCPTGARVVEIADLEFPNPNFYALAAAMGHSYWLLAASPCGLGAPPERDLRLDPAALRGVLNQLI
jgi:capsular polysaccharide biosynthesis protein